MVNVQKEMYGHTTWQLAAVTKAPPHMNLSQS
ncbi:hypothetical protein PMI32_04156 [Pseudomonas sp. GM60]|nr:hypothetical protein PMI32_04156 [Pseudomonas sp. GM60]